MAHLLCHFELFTHSLPPLCAQKSVHALYTALDIAKLILDLPIELLAIKLITGHIFTLLMQYTR